MRAARKGGSRGGSSRGLGQFARERESTLEEVFLLYFCETFSSLRLIQSDSFSLISRFFVAATSSKDSAFFLTVPSDAVTTKEGVGDQFQVSVD